MHVNSLKIDQRVGDFLYKGKPRFAYIFKDIVSGHWISYWDTILPAIHVLYDYDFNLDNHVNELLINGNTILHFKRGSMGGLDREGIVLDIDDLEEALDNVKLDIGSIGYRFREQILNS
jgi:hypothetical protein